MRIDIKDKVLSKNDIVANRLRERFAKSGTFVINLASSPGSGKTTLLEKLLPRLKDSFKLAVVEGDLRTENDANRLRQVGVNAVQIQTGDACHLEAAQVESLLEGINADELDILIIENIGNLVCPASYDLGEDLFFIMLSTAEGDDKPAKYPTIFFNADYFILNKIDLAPYVDFDIDRCVRYATDINAELKIFKTSARTEEGLDALADEIARLATEKRATLILR
ncbi:MAG: hydrogenase nickel incorporation protein HypB [Deferribacteraceae bacterium]|jgi:hydrogenase nickel incorporation protein HypB|nr:hydrogenase nickel incorporation protein HypB [Deferribacteraceae bacterium]